MVGINEVLGILKYLLFRHVFNTREKGLEKLGNRFDARNFLFDRCPQRNRDTSPVKLILR